MTTRGKRTPNLYVMILAATVTAILTGCGARNRRALDNPAEAQTQQSGQQPPGNA